MSDNAIVHELELSLKAHIESLWAGDKYTPTGTLTSAAIVPTGLRTLLKYTDKDSAVRYFGPQQIAIGRVQDDVINLANKAAVPSAYIEIAPNDFDNVETWRHSIYKGIDGSQNIDNLNRVMEVGNSHMMHRRLVLKMTIYFLESDQGNTEVDRIGNAASSFLEALTTSHTMMTAPWSWNMKDADGNSIVDPFGETPIRSLPVIVHSRRRGGGPDNYIWDIKIYIEVQCFKEA